MFKTEKIKTNEKFLSIVFWSIIGITAFLLTQKFFEFHFYYVEQLQLFLYNKMFLSKLFYSYGGLSELISRWCIQFYIYPKAGALINTLILLLVAILMYEITKKINTNNISLILFPLLSSILFFFIHLDHNYYVSGTIAYILVLATFLVFLNIDKHIVKIAATTMLAVLLFWWAGSAAYLFALTVIVWQLLSNKKQILYSFIPLALILILTYVGVNLGWIGDYKQAFLPRLYFHPKVTPLLLIYFSWGLLLVLVLLAFALKDKRISQKLQYIISLSQIAIACVVIYYLMPKYGQLSSYQYKKLDYYTRMGRWGDIIEESKKPSSNLLQAYYINIALMETNQLGKQFQKLDLKGVSGLIPIENKELPSLLTLNELNFSLGDIAASQSFAFESNIAISKTGSPRLYKRLVQTNLISKNHSVAEKYIKLLEQTHYYKEWATKHRRFLHNDKAVEEDPLLGKKRRGIPARNYFLGNTGLINSVQHLAEADPANKAAIEYLASVYLYAKQINLFIEHINEYYNTDELLLNLPEKFQEAIIIFSENNPAEWDRYNIKPDIVEKYVIYKQMFLENQHKPNIAEIMNRSFGNTYWFYFMFYN